MVPCIGHSEDYDKLFEQMEPDSAPVSSTNQEEVTTNNSPLEISGNHFVSLSVPVLQNHRSLDGRIKSPHVDNNLKLRVEKDKTILRAGARLRLQVSPTGDMADITTIEPLENSLTLTYPWIHFGVGFQYYSWGTADQINPTDNLNPSDYTVGPDAEILPLFSAAASVYPIRWLQFQTVFSPFEQADRFPVSAAQNIPDGIFDKVSVEKVTLTPTGIEQQTTRIDQKRTIYEPNLPYKLSSSLFGTRGKILTGPLDFSISYLYDYDSYFTPRISMERYQLVDTNTTFSPGIPPELQLGMGFLTAWRVNRIDLVRNRIHRIGTDFKTVSGQYGIWGEACYSITEDTDNSSWKLRNHSLAWTLGFDFTYGESERHYCNVQQVGKYIIDYDNQFFNDYPSGQPSPDRLSEKEYMEKYYYRMLTQALGMETEQIGAGLAIKLEWSLFNQRIKPAIEGLYMVPLGYDNTNMTRYGDGVGKASIRWEPSDNIQLQIGGEGFYSMTKFAGEDSYRNNEKTALGLYYPSSRGFVEMTYTWAE